MSSWHGDQWRLNGAVDSGARQIVHGQIVHDLTASGLSYVFIALPASSLSYILIPGEVPMTEMVIKSFA